MLIKMYCTFQKWWLLSTVYFKLTILSHLTLSMLCCSITHRSIAYSSMDLLNLWEDRWHMSHHLSVNKCNYSWVSNDANHHKHIATGEGFFKQKPACKELIR